MAESDNRPLPKFGAAHRRAIRRYLWTVVAPILSLLIVANAGVWVWVFKSLKEEAVSGAVKAAKEEMNRDKVIIDFYRDRAQESERAARESATQAKVSEARFKDIETDLVKKAREAESAIELASKGAKDFNLVKEMCDRVEKDKLTIAEALSGDQKFVATVRETLTRKPVRLDLDKYEIPFFRPAQNRRGKEDADLNGAVYMTSRVEFQIIQDKNQDVLRGRIYVEASEANRDGDHTRLSGVGEWEELKRLKKGERVVQIGPLVVPQDKTICSPAIGWLDCGPPTTGQEKQEKSHVGDGIFVDSYKYIADVPGGDPGYTGASARLLRGLTVIVEHE